MCCILYKLYICIHTEYEHDMQCICYEYIAYTVHDCTCTHGTLYSTLCGVHSFTYLTLHYVTLRYLHTDRHTYAHKYAGTYSVQACNHCSAFTLHGNTLHSIWHCITYSIAFHCTALHGITKYRIASHTCILRLNMPLGIIRPGYMYTYTSIIPCDTT